MSELRISSMSYQPILLKSWKQGKYSMLTSSRCGASRCLKKILREKAETRRKGRISRGQSGDRRFFGEAYVATHIKHEHGWYGSFKWLMAPEYLQDREPSGRYCSELWNALREHFPGQLKELQRKAHELFTTRSKQLGNKKPVPPDLWLIDAHGNHRFVEVKLPGDKIKPHQLAGLALIASYLSATAPISVEIIELVPEGGNGPRASGSEKRIFDQFCGALRS